MSSLRDYLKDNYITDLEKMNRVNVLTMIFCMTDVVFDAKPPRWLIEESIFPIMALRWLGELKMLLRCEDPKVGDLVDLCVTRLEKRDEGFKTGEAFSKMNVFYRALHQFLRVRDKFLDENSDLLRHMEDVEDRYDSLQSELSQAEEALTMMVTEHRTTSFESVIQQYIGKINEIDSKTQKAERKRDSADQELQSESKKHRARNAEVESAQVSNELRATALSQNEYDKMFNIRSQAENELNKLRGAIVENPDELRDKAQEAAQQIREEEQTCKEAEDSLEVQREAEHLPAQYGKLIDQMLNLMNSIEASETHMNTQQESLGEYRKAIEQEKCAARDLKSELADMEIHGERKTRSLQKQLNEIKDTLKAPVETEAELELTKAEIPKVTSNIVRMKADCKIFLRNRRIAVMRLGEQRSQIEELDCESRKRVAKAKFELEKFDESLKNIHEECIGRLHQRQAEMRKQFQPGIEKLCQFGLADRFAWISDIHIDPLYDPRANQETYCRKNGEIEPVHHKNKFGANVGLLDAGFEISKPVVTIPAYHGRYGCDPPVSLVRSMLSSVESAKPQFTLVTGDFAAHYWGEGSKKWRWQALKNATYELYSGLRDQRFIFCVGNNDVGRDYQPQSNSSWNQKLFDLWSPRSVPPDQHRTFLEGLYYRVDLQPTFTILCLNTVWFSVHAEPTKQALAQLNWLEKQLSECGFSGRQVLIAGHIPPGQALYRTDNNAFVVEKQWHDSYDKRYTEIAMRFNAIIVGQFYGHYHTDEFRIKSTKSQPHGSLILMAPGVCGSHGTNPAWRLVEFSNNTIADYIQYYTPLYGDEESLGTFGQESVNWIIGYRARDIYSELSGPALWKYKITNLSDYWYRESVGGGYPPIFILRCILFDTKWKNWDQCIEEEFLKWRLEIQNKKILVVKS